jgi:hypothetical protein
MSESWVISAYNFHLATLAAVLSAAPKQLFHFSSNFRQQ